jgi:hypothetical protein
LFLRRDGAIPPGPFRTSPYPGILADCFPQKKAFQDELPFADNEVLHRKSRMLLPPEKSRQKTRKKRRDFRVVAPN